MTKPVRFSLILTAAFAAAVVFVAPAQAQRERLSLSERVADLESRMGNPEDRETLTEMVLRLNRMEEEIRDLRGLVEEQRFEIDNLRESQRDLYLDLDRRLSQGGAQDTPDGGSGNFGAPRDRRSPGSFGPTRPDAVSDDGGPGPIPGDQPQTSPVVLDDGQADPGVIDLGGEVPEVREPIEAELETAGLGERNTTELAALADPVAERNAYNEAFDALKSGRYAESARLFAAFLDRFPGGEYADNAQYWLGESYYVTGNYRIALDAFRELLDRFPNSAKAADARLKLGYTYFSLQEWSEAERVLKDVIAQYPNSTVSRLAENRLRTMRIQGHIQ